MTSPPGRWHHDSQYGDGPRRALDREQRARFRFLLSAHRRVRRISPLTEVIGVALLKRLSVDGRCDPGHDTLADDAGCSARTVRRGLDRLRELGLVLWMRRIVRDGWRVQQTSNAYLLALTENPPARPVLKRMSTGGQSGRETLQKILLDAAPPSAAEVRAAREALVQRQRIVEARLLNKGKLA